MTPSAEQIQAGLIHSLNTQHFTLLQIIAFGLSFLVPTPFSEKTQTTVSIIQGYYFLISHILPIILLLLGIFLLFKLVYLLIGLYLLKKDVYEDKQVLQIIPPDSVTKSPLSTQEFLTALHDIGMYTKTYFKFFHVKRKFSFEIVATREDGIRYFIVVTQVDLSLVVKTFRSYLPEANIILTNDYMPIEKNKVVLSRWSLIADIVMRNNVFFPLGEKKILTEHDPISYLTGHMTKLNGNEMIILQIVASSVNTSTHKRFVKKIEKISEAVRNSFSLKPFVKQRLSTTLPWLPLKIIGFCFLFILGLAIWQINLLLFIITFGGVKMLIVEIFRRQNQIVKLNPADKQLYQDIEAKLSQGLFETTIRLFIATNEKEEIGLRGKGIISSFATFDYSNVQLLDYKTQSWWIPVKLGHSFNNFKLKNRILSLTQNPVLAISELSNMYHLPYTSTTKTEGLVKEKTKTLPAPLQFKQLRHILDLDIYFGKNVYHGEWTDVGLTTEERKRHMYILGATGTGKSTLLSRMINFDIGHGKGICVIDPHGDLTQSILGTISKNRIKDVVYFNPMDRKYPVGLNILELPKNLTEEQLQEEKDIITSSIISIFHKLYTKKYFGPRMEHILRYSILAALETENPTLFTVQKILTDKNYRNKLIPKITDPVVKDFWLHEFKRLGSYQQAEVTSPITNKIGQFLASSLCRNILGQSKSTIDFENIINEGKILICSIPKGGIGEDNSAFFGALITAKIQLAALRRVRVPEKKRRDFYLYIDEFQNFATDSFAQILSEARKYGLSAILAHQTIAQIDDTNLTKVILANVGTVICFRTSSPVDEDYILPILKPQVEKGEIVNLPSYSFYCKINAIKPYDTFSGVTVPLDVKFSKKTIETIITQSQKLYGVERKKVEDNIKQFYLNQPSMENTLDGHESGSAMA